MNQFIYRGPLPQGSRLFYGRTTELARLTRLCQDEVQGYAIVYGGYQNGKTSLLLRLMEQLPDSLRVCPINFQVIPGATLPQVCAHLARCIARSLTRSAAPVTTTPPNPQDAFSIYEARLSRLLEGMGLEHPHYSEVLTYQQRLEDNIRWSRLYGDTETARAVRNEVIAQLNALTHSTLGVSFNELAVPFGPVIAPQPALDVTDAPDLIDFLCGALAAPEAGRLVLFLEELGALPQATRKGLADVLQAIFMSRFDPAQRPLTKLMIVLAGGIELYDLAASEVSTLHNICKAIDLPDLGDTDAVALIAGGLASLGMPRAKSEAKPEALGQAIFKQVGGHPYLTQRMGGYLEEYLDAGEYLTLAHVDRAAKQILHDDPLLYYLRKALGEEQLLNDVKALLNRRLRFTRLDEAMSRLELLGLVTKSGDFWAPRNPLLARALHEWSPHAPAQATPLARGLHPPDRNQLHGEISSNERQAGRRQCFIGHESHNRDVRVKLESALQNEGLSAYFADKEVISGSILSKVYKKILVTCASIVDLTSANPNVYFELGVAIGLNKPVLVICRDTTIISPLLKRFVKVFSSYTDLEEKLKSWLPSWRKNSFGHDLPFSPHCIFVDTYCPDRQRVRPQQSYLVIDQRDDGTNFTTPAGDPDLASELRRALDCFEYAPVFLNTVSPQGTPGLCEYCRSLRDSAFALCHLTPHSSNNVYLLLGLTTGLRIPPLLLIRRERDSQGQRRWQLPSLLQGLDVFYYESYAEIGDKLGAAINDSFLNECRKRLGLIELDKQKVSTERPRGALVEGFDFQPPALKSEHNILSQLPAQRSQPNQASTPPNTPPRINTTYAAKTIDSDELPADPVRDRLPEYAHASALGSIPEQLYPDVAAHLAGCAACQEELNELLELTEGAYEGHLDAAPNYPKPNLTFLNRPAPKATQETCWFDDLGRLVIEFSQALLDSLRGPSLAGASRGQFLFRYVQEPGPLRVTIEAYAEDAFRQEGRVQVNVDVHSRDVLEQQGSRVTLRMDTSTWEGETDEMGSVDFAPIPLAMLPRMRVEIAPAGMRGRPRSKRRRRNNPDRTRRGR